MSDQTFEAMDAAIRKHFADEHPGQFVGDWVMVGQITSIDAQADDSAYRIESPGMAPRAQLGLLQIGANLMDQLE